MILGVAVNLMLIAVISVFIIDYSGFVGEIEQFISGFMTRAQGRRVVFRIPKPFSCSLCTVFWVGVLYIIITGNLNLINTAIVCAIAGLTSVIFDMMTLIRDILIKIIAVISNILKL